MMSSKLAFRNVRKSFRDYGIYFLTLMLGVCIFYVFNSIESQQSMMVISESQMQVLQTLDRIIGYVSIFISVILGFLIVYANGFLIKRRKKELGIYQTLGMEKGQISRILMIETTLVGIISLVVGLCLGVFLSQGFAVITASLFEVKLKSFTFIFSQTAMVKAIVYFGLSFLLVMIFNSITIGRQKLIDLIYADRKNEKFKSPHLVLSVALFIISIICLGVAYKMIIETGILEITKEFWTSTGLGIVGTFLFFFSLSGFFLKVIQQNKKIYLKNLNMFVLRQLNSKINTNYISMTMVCLMLFVAICTLSSGMGMSKAMTAELNEITPYDATFIVSAEKITYDNETGEETKTEKLSIDLDNGFKNLGIDLTTFAKGAVEVKLYETEIDFKISDMYFEPDFIKLSDYNTLLTMQGLETATLSQQEMIVSCKNNELKNMVLDYMNTNEIKINGTNLKLKETNQIALINAYSSINLGFTIVVSDELLENRNISTDLMVINYIEPTDHYDEMYVAASDKMRLALRDIVPGFNEGGVSYETSSISKIKIFESSKSTSAAVAYLAVYLGIIFLLISAVVLAIAQLSEAADNKKRYELLRKIGVEKTMINRALLCQIAIYFVMPLTLATIHSVVGIKVASYMVEMIGQANILRDSIFVSIVIITIYGGYFVATYLGSKSIISK